MGSWLARLAARYRMNLPAFAEQSNLSLPSPLPNVGWLLMPPLCLSTAQRLAELTRLSCTNIEAMQTPPEWIYHRTSLPVCARCLFVNPVNLAAPYWKHAWLEPQYRSCPLHADPMLKVRASRLRACKSMTGVLRAVSWSERLRERRR